MRISDWSSDVCSSDLIREELKAANAQHKQSFKEAKQLAQDLFAEMKIAGALPTGAKKAAYTVKGTQAEPDYDSALAIVRLAADQRFESDRRDAIERSEEHTSELQSLMRNSSAGFCL